MASKSNTRRVSLAPGTKTEDGKGKPKTPPSSRSNDINPIKRKGEIKRSHDVRSQRDAYAREVAEERAEQERELQELRDAIAYYKKDNEKILRQQTSKFGLTLDNMKYLTSDLQHAKATNDQLYREVEQRKTECDKLETELGIVVERIDELVSICDDMKFENKCFKIEQQRAEILEGQIQRLTKSNRGMRTLLLQNKINPDLEQTSKQGREPAQTRRSSMLPAIRDRHVVLKHAKSMDSLLVMTKPDQQKTAIKRMKSQPPRTNSYKHMNQNNRRRHSFFLPRIKPMEIFK